MKTFIIALLLTVSSVVIADEISLVETPVESSSIVESEAEDDTTPDYKSYFYTGAWSYHITPYNEDDEGFDDYSGHDDYNSDHNLVAVQYKSYMFTSFTNSHYRESYSISKNFYSRSIGNIDINMQIGVVYGYATCMGGQGSSQGESKFCPMFVPSISYTKFKVEPTFMLLNNALAFTLRWEI